MAMISVPAPAAVSAALSPQASIFVPPPYLKLVRPASVDFDPELDIVHAYSHSLRDLAFRLKYHTFCVVRGFEDPEDYPDGRYVDRYDKHSMWTLVKHGQAGRFLGGVRFILKRPGKKLQFQKKCTLPGRIRRNGLVVAEISSFMADCGNISLKRTRFGNGLGQISLQLMKACFAMGAMASPKVDAVCGLMCPALLKLFHKCGVHFQNVGQPVDFHGIRQPCWGTARELLMGIKEVDRQLFEFVKPSEEYLDYLGVSG